MLNVRICVGTTCYVMGGADLLVVNEVLTQEEKRKVNVSFVPCLGYCKGANKKPPFVEIDGKLYEEIDLDSLIKIIREKIGEPKC